MYVNTKYDIGQIVMFFSHENKIDHYSEIKSIRISYDNIIYLMSCGSLVVETEILKSYIELKND